MINDSSNLFLLGVDKQETGLANMSQGVVRVCEMLSPEQAKILTTK